MDNKRRQKNTTQPKATTPVEKKRLLRKEWPLLLYPALALAALAVLYTVNRSLQEELVRSGSQPRGDQPTAIATEDANRGDPSMGRAESGAIPQVHALIPSDPQTTPPDQIDQTPASAAVPATLRPGDRLTELNGTPAGGGEPQTRALTAVLLGDLRQAVKTQDHARIKQCMNDLVALGDEAVASLTEIITSGKDETALWAAEALARIGTPVAATALLGSLEQIKEGSYKEQLAKRASTISNHDSWPILLDTVQDTKDPTVRRAAATSLSRMADTAVVDEIVTRYDAALTTEDAARLAQVVGNISSPGASESLRSLAGPVSSTPRDGLEKAAIDAMAKIGDAESVSYLLRKLEASPPGEGSYLFHTVTAIDQPRARSALLYAAAGSKEVSAEHGRTAAIYALENYPSEETCQLLEQIVDAEDNTAVATAALRTLENIEKRAPAVAARVTSKMDTASMLPFNPLQK